MEFTLGKYITRNGSEVEIYYRHHGLFLAGRPIKGYPQYKHPRWTFKTLSGPYTSSHEAIFVEFGGKRLDSGLDLVSRAGGKAHRGGA